MLPGFEEDCEDDNSTNGVYASGVDLILGSDETLWTAER